MLGHGPFAASAAAQSAASAKVPDRRNFRTGDFIWPKKDGTFVPYSGTAQANAVVDEEELGEDEWMRARVQFIRRARSSATTGPDAEYHRRVADRLEDMTYTTFFHDYAAGITPSRFQTFGFSSLFYVGHVAIIDVDATDGRPYVIEAILGKSLACRKCVQRVPYDAWLKARGDIYVWHGRVRGADAAAGSAIASAARPQIGKPYEFLNWDLLNEADFYCSKLVWYSVYKALGIALDNDTNPKRFIGFSPLQAIRSEKRVELLFNPGNYQNV